MKDAQPTYQVIMPKLTKLAIAASLVMAILLGISHLGGSVDAASVAWAEVVRHIEQVDHFHFYYIETEPNGHSFIREGWYAHGKIRTQQYDAEQTIDNGAIWVVMDEHHNVIKKGKSTLAEYDNIFDALTKDMLSYRSSQFENKTPISVGSDFLIYEFERPEDKAEWIDKTSVTVGRQSLMPVQIKTYFKKGKWSMNHLLVFDYEAPPKPEAFFTVSAQAVSAHGKGRIVLGAEPVTIGLQNAIGIKEAIVRLRTENTGVAQEKLTKYWGKDHPHGDPVAFLDVTFITDDYGRTYTETSPLWLEEGFSGIAKLSESKSDNQYHFIVYTSVLKPTQESNVYSLELSCWLKTKRLFQKKGTKP
ncbi:hypothetical protein ACFL5Z_07855 [Planctomycetota bacterium]